MSRPVVEVIPVKPSPDIYTGLLAAALVAVICGLVILFVRAQALFPDKSIFS